MYLAYSEDRWPLQRVLWQYVESGVLQLYVLSDEDIVRMRVPMEKYRDTPMDLADASLVATAEALHLKRIFTLDSDFLGYRLNDQPPLRLFPSSAKSKLYAELSQSEGG